MGNIGGFIDDLKIYDARDVLELSLSGLTYSCSIYLKPNKLPVNIKATRNTIAYTCKPSITSDGTSYTLEIYWSIPGNTHEDYLMFRTFQYRKFIVVAITKGGEKLIFGTLDRPLSVQLEPIVSADFSANYIKIVMSGQSLYLPLFLKN